MTEHWFQKKYNT